MLLCIYAIVAFVTTMVCGFRPDFTFRVYCKKNQAKQGKQLKKKNLFECLAELLPSVILTRLRLSDVKSTSTHSVDLGFKVKLRSQLKST